MTEPEHEEITLCLRDMEAGDEEAANRLLPLVYKDLRAVAGQVFGSRRQVTMQPTALVHETYLRLVRPEGAGWSNRAHFLRVAAMAMRQLLTDYARARNAEKRGGENQAALVGHENDPEDTEVDGLDLLALHEALETLRGLNERHAEIVEMRFFAGLTVEEIANTLGLTERTVYLDWKMARTWLQRELGAQLDE